jgi:hypothetical protein
MPNGTIGNDLRERQAAPVGSSGLLSRDEPKNATPASSQNESKAFASLLELYLAHEFGASMKSARYQDPTISLLREEGEIFDRAALNSFLHTAQRLYAENAISSEQYSKAIAAFASMYVEQYASFKLDSYLEKVSSYIFKAFRRVPH